MSEYIAVKHRRFVKAQRAIFTKQVVADCMDHRCHMVDSGALKLDACCQYGVDVDVAERDAIVEHTSEIKELLIGEAASALWFDEEEHTDADFPSGRYVRSRTHSAGGGHSAGCIFLAHDRRGCAIHRAAIAGGWDFRGVKPHVCRLFPISYESDAIVLSDDYADYSCSRDAGAPSVYRVSRATLADIFGRELTAALDEAESAVLQSPLRVMA